MRFLYLELTYAFCISCDLLATYSPGMLNEVWEGKTLDTTCCQ